MTNYIKDMKTKQFWVYFARWQISAWLMMPVMVYLESLGISLLLNLMIGQAFGSLVFWKIDQYIFRNHKTDNIEDVLDASMEPSVSERKL